MTSTTPRQYDMVIPNISIKLNGWFVEYFCKRKPKGMSDEDFVNAVISSWLLDNHDEITMGDKR